jgi:transcriptional regulator GlxA family with amidase domain
VVVLLGALTLLVVVSCGTPAPGRQEPDWTRLPRPTDLPRDRPLRAAFLAVDGVYDSELMAPYDVLQHTVFHTHPGIETFVVSPDGRPVRTFEGITIVPGYGFDDAPAIDILIVPSAEHSMDTDLDDARLIDWVRDVGGRARFVISACDGAFVLAAAGLLDGREATTFPSDQEAFAARFPSVLVRREPSFVHDGAAITSHGGARSYDPAMYLVDHLYGEDVARGVGRGLLIPWPPAPGTMPARVVPPRP